MSPVISLYKEAFSNIQRNIWILSIAMFINRSGAIVLLFTSLYLTKVLHFSMAEAGFMLSFYGIGSIIGSYTGGWLTDNGSHKNIMVSSLFVSGGILLLLLLAESKIAVSTIIFFYALSADIFRPAQSSAIVEFSTAENRTRSVSLSRLAINLGFSVGPAVGGFIALHLGYKWLFVMDASTSLIAGVMLYFYLPQQSHEALKAKEKSAVKKTKSAYRDYRYLFYILLVTFYSICFFQMFASMPQYFSRVCQFSEDRIGILLAFNGILVVAFEMPLVTYLQKKGNTFSLIIAGVLFLPVSFSVLYLAGCGFMFALLYTVFITLAEILAMPFMMNYAISRPQPERQGQYSALYSIAYGIGNIVAPALGLGIAGRFSFDILFLFLIAMSICVAIGFWWLKNKEEHSIRVNS